MLINYNIPLTRARQNALIKARVLAKEEMEKAGFILTSDGKYWKLTRVLSHEEIHGDNYDTTLEISINNKTNKIHIDVLDELWLQIYDYQAILRVDPSHPYALDIHFKVQKVMETLLELKIITGYIPGDYI